MNLEMLVFALAYCEEVHFASFLSGVFITPTVLNPSERKLANSPLCTGAEIFVRFFGRIEKNNFRSQLTFKSITVKGISFELCRFLQHFEFC